MSDYGYLIQKDNYGKSSNVDKYKKIVENMQTETTKKNVSYEPVNVNSFINSKLPSIQEVEKKIYTLPDGTMADKAKYTPEEQQKLMTGQYVINPNYNPSEYMSQKILYKGQLKDANQVEQERWDNADTSGKAQIVAGKVGNTVKNIGTSAILGPIQAAEGMVDTGLTVAANVANLVGAKDTSDYITNMIKIDSTGDALKKLENSTNSKYGKYNPNFLGVGLNDIAREGTRMLTAGSAGMPGFITSAIGGNVKEALNEGQSLGRASAYGAITGTIEGATEKLFDTFNLLGGGVLDKFMPKNVIARLATAPLGEYVEEWISQGANPFVKMATYDTDIKNPFGSWENFKEWLSNNHEAGWQGYVMGLVLQSGSDISNSEARKQYKDEVTKAVNKIQGLTQHQKQEAINSLVKGIENSKIQYESVKQLASPPANENRNYENNGNIVLPQSNNSNLTTPEVKYSPVNAKQVLVEPTNQMKGLENLIPQKNSAPQSAVMNSGNAVQQTNQVEGKTAQNGNIEQIVRNDAKLEESVRNLAKDLNVEAEFVEIDDVSIEGYEQNGKIYINRKAEKPYNRIFKHELTHYLEQNGVSHAELSKEIMNSNAFANQLEDLGMNLDEYRQKIINRYAEKGINLTEEDANREIISKFVEEKMFNDEKSVRRLAEENPGLMQKIKNWIDDMIVKFKGTAEEKELLRMQKMYKEALSQIERTNQTSESQYSIAGIKGARRLAKNPQYSNIIEQYKTAKKLYKEGYDNARLIEETGWYRDNKGNWKYEFTDEDMTLKKNIKLDDKKMYALDRMLEHDILFEAYPQLKNYTVMFANIGNGNRAGIYAPAKIILLNPKYANTKATVEYELAHEIQHAIQAIEGFPGSTSKKKGGYAYYTSLGEIEARDVSERLRMLQNERKQFAPETSKENPVHEGMERYLQNRSEEQRIQDEEYIQKQEAKEKIKESIKSFFEKGGVGYDQDITMDNNKNNTEAQSTTNRVLHNENTENKRLAGKWPAFSLSETNNTSNARALSRYAQTLQKKHKDIPEHVNLIQKEIDNGNFMHEVIRDRRALNYAENYIKDNGFEDAIKHWDELMKRGKSVDKDELALGQTIYNLAVENKDTRLVMKMASDLVQEYTEIGRNLQSATLLRKMTPDGRLYALERSVQKINQDLMQKFDDFENIEIPEKLADELLNSETQKQMDDAVERIQQYIADQIPATWQEKLNSWRYLSMLGNPRTHIRNIIGNAVFIPAVEMKNAVAQVGEKFIPQEQRTKAMLGKEDADLLKYAENDFDRNKETIRGENKYDIKSGIQEKRTIYSTKALEAARKGNFDLLEAEDAFFLKYRYKKAFAQALKAKGITLEQIKNPTPEITRKVSETRIYAINEAQKATYRDASIVASTISKSKNWLLKKSQDSKAVNLAYFFVEGVMPFTKTPVNIVRRGIEYSPFTLMQGIKNAMFDVKKGKITASQAIDRIASGATGSAIVGLGYFLASLGLIGGGEEEKDKEQTLKELQGYQNYALNIFGKSYTIDWSAPSSIPLFIGVELYKSLSDEDESNVLNAIMNVAEPVIEMSMLQGINEVLTSLGEDEAIIGVVANAFLSYLGQYNPTLFGQIARTIDPVRRTSYIDKNIKIPAKVQRFIQQQVAKIPGASKLLPSYKDQFGQEQITDSFITRVFQNFLSPGYIKDIKEGPVEKGLAELYEKTGETKIIPSYASKTLTVDGEKINLTAKEYDTYAKTRGNVSMKGLEGLLGDKNYKNLSDEQKTKVIEGIYDYANDVAKSKVLKGFALEGNSKKAQELENKGMDFYKFIMIKKTADTDGNGYVSDSELNKAISKYDATRWKGLIKKKEK